MTELKNKIAIVTGAAVGLGNAYAKALAKEGVNLAVCDIRPEIDQVKDELAETGVSCIASTGNVSDPDFVKHFVDVTKSKFGQIDILINNAGVWGASVADDDMEKTLEDYENIVGTNLKGEFLFGRAVIPVMIDQGKGGDIINIATDHMVTCGTPYYYCEGNSECPHQDDPHGIGNVGGGPRPTGGGDAMDLYDASKWALNGLLYGWAKALKDHRIRVNALCMGATDSYMLRSFHEFNPSDEEVSQWMRAEDNAKVMIGILKEGVGGRNAQNHQFCMGREVVLESPRPQIYVLEDDVKIGGQSHVG